MAFFLLLVAIWLLAQAINLRSVWYSLLFLVSLGILLKIFNRRATIFGLLFLSTISFSVNISPVQNFLVSRVTKVLSRNLHTEISIRHIDLALFNKMLLEGVLVKDHNRDTLLYAGEAKVRITDWFFMKDKVELQYIGLSDASILLHRRDSVWNYQFLADYFSGQPSSPDKRGISLYVKKADLANIHILKRDEWRGEDMELRLKSLNLDADKIDISNKLAKIRSLDINQPDFAIRNYPGRRPEPADSAQEKIKNDPLHLRWNPAGWDITVDHSQIRNGSFKNDKLTDIHPYEHFDGNHIYFSSINWDFKNVRFRNDTITARMNLNTRERSGLVVRKFTAQMKFYPEAMEFAGMDIQTEKSRLRDFFAMRFRSFDDLSDYLNKVKMEGNFKGSEIASDDIAFFAPELQSWKKVIRITGNIHGPVRDLIGRNILINAGQNTLLNGDIHLRGLPEIDTTFIEFKSNNFRTTYKDVVTFIPSLKDITQPRIDRIGNLHFVGNFNGTIHNFVTSGTIETDMGALVSNVNMKLRTNKPSVYSGNIVTDNFDLGQFLDDDALGKISFHGNVDGNGLTSKTINATLDGTIYHFDFNNYTYHDIVVNGTVAQKKFNGKLISNDSNLNASLNGLIDYGQLQPKFDFDAEITSSNLQKLHFTQDDIEFNGKLRFNFTGDDIDNFLGSARIYNASLYKKGQRISFDSLTLESSIIDSNKTITVLSNEFDGAIVGTFSIKELPAAFQTFLNRYYPSYVKPSKNIISNQNFSFVVTTKKIDEYLDLFDKNLKGFNYTSVTGRIDSRENLLDLNAAVPQFNYKNIAFYNVNLKGRGNFDSLGLEATMGEIYVSDSLHFPSTHIQLKSFNDLSDIRVTTSANQTLNSANISARVQTLARGIHITFNPSTFELNNKTWSIDRNGQLSFANDVVSADALKIYSGDQQVLLSTVPSTEGDWNDIHVELKKINIGDFTPYFVKDERVEGLLTGSGVVTNPFHNPGIRFNGGADQFRLEDDSIGKLVLQADYSQQSGLVHAAVSSDNRDYHFDLRGTFTTQDSSSEQPININISKLVDTRIDLLKKYLGGIFSNITGKATGNLQIIGPSSGLKYLGDIRLTDGRLRVNYTQVTYFIPSAQVAMRDGYIDFGSFVLKDSLGNTAEMIKGKLFHNSFRDLRYDFALSTNKLLMLNTRYTDNNQFYGTLIGKANITLTGPQENIQMYIKGEPKDSSNIYLPTTTSRESSEADFIVWKVYGKEMKPQEATNSDNNFTVTLDITANNYANVYVIIDPLTRDIIRANGHGNLRIRVGTNENMDMRGRYEIDRGDYNFTFQTFIRKPFVFKEGVGNYIQWTGDPYNADINIQAIYEAENVQFSDLGLGSTIYNSTLYDVDKLKSFHGQVWVVATLTDKLMKPNISFEIELPPNSELKNVAGVSLLFDAIAKDPNELNKQVAYLIVFNSFGPLTSSGTALSPNEAVSGIVYSSISSAVSSTLSHLASKQFQKIFKDKSIQVNFNTSFYNVYNSIQGVSSGGSASDYAGGSFDRTNLNLSVMKSFLNERLTFTLGSAFDFGITAQQIQASSFQFLPNVTAEWKVTPSGKVVLSFFYRDSYNYLSVTNHTQNSSGASISYRRDFDRIDELFKSKKKDGKKDEKKQDKKDDEKEKEVSRAND